MSRTQVTDAKAWAAELGTNLFFFSLLEKMRSLSGTHCSMFTNTTSLWNWVFQHLMYICLAVEQIFVDYKN